MEYQTIRFQEIFCHGVVYFQYFALYIILIPRNAVYIPRNAVYIPRDAYRDANTDHQYEQLHLIILLDWIIEDN